MKTEKLCPEGWHVPTQIEWDTLFNTLGRHLAMTKIKEAGTAHWNAPNEGTNNCGFTALPAGIRQADGTFLKLGCLAVWWTATEPSMNYPVCISIETGSFLREAYGISQLGNSVRCIKDN